MGVIRRQVARTSQLLGPSKQGSVDETLRFIAQRGWRGSDAEFFSALATHLAKSLDVAYAFVDRIVPEAKDTVETIALYAHGNIVNNMEYSLAGTPCENVIGRKLCCYVDKLRERFPSDAHLAAMRAESYAGIPLWAVDGRPLGLIAVMDVRPLENTALVETLLRIVALRASAALERNNMYAELENSRQRFRDFATSSSDWFWEMDEKLRFSYFSDRFTEITGVSDQDLLGRTRRQSGIGNSVDPEYYQAHLDDLAAHRPFRHFIHPRNKPDGSVVYLAISGMPVFDDVGKFRGYRGIGTDITEQRLTEAARDRALAEAQNANRAKSQFLATMSHEFRTPLNAILGFSEFLKHELFGPLGDPRYQDYARDIYASGQHLLDLISDILDVSRIEAGRYELNIAEVDIGGVVKSTCGVLREQARAKGIRIHTRIVGNPPAIWVDDRAMRQILLNLLSNAIKFTPCGGEVRVRVTLDRRGRTNIVVADTGIGIPEEDMQSILTPFSQLANNSLATEGGTGLGLSIVNALAGLHGGTLDIESKVGKGTRIRVQLPKSCLSDRPRDAEPDQK